jgi:transcriptional regulator with XRE-family HTH domain
MPSSPASLVAVARADAGLTQRALATRANTSAAAINRYERGRSVPDLATLERVLAACGFELQLTMTRRSAHRPADTVRPDQAAHDRHAIEEALAEADERDGWVRPRTSRTTR